MMTSPQPTIRPATADDLSAAAAIYAANEAESSTRYHPLLGEVFDYAESHRGALEDLQLAFADDPRQVWIAEDPEIGAIGFAAAIFRAHHWHLTYLFVAKDARQKGIGAALLTAIHQAGRDAGCTSFSLQASDDPRALTRYLSLGLKPRPSSINWHAREPRFPAPDPMSRLHVIPLSLEDEALLNTIDDIDKAVRGVRHRQDLQRWLQKGERGALVVERESDTPVGYFFVSVDKDAGRIGPVASLAESRFREVLDIALRAAAELHRTGVTWSAISPGENHAAIDGFFDAGFRPGYCDIFLASGPIGRWESYLLHDVDYL